jgi:glycosyltransferase involved in cell wall biosynthesis
MPHSNPFYRLGIQLPALTKAHRLDLLHTQYICPPLLRAKTAVTIHDILFEDFPQYFETFLRLRSKLLFRLSASTSEMIFTGSNYSKDKLMQTYGVPSAKLTTLWNGASEGRFFPGTEGADEVRKLGVSPGEYLLSVGRLEPRKNRLGLLRALALLPTPRPKLVIAGQRDFGYEKIFQLRDELLLQDDVIFVETASDDLLASLYRNARLFVYPSYAEGFGMPVIEAMASGIPVITSNTTSLGEVAGDAALLVDPHSPEEIRDAMNRVLHDEELAARMRKAGIARAEVFNWDGAADMLASKYRAYFSLEARHATQGTR